MNVKHTPWSIGKWFSRHNRQHIPILDSEKRTIVITWPEKTDISENDVANAKAMAAAPELLEVVKLEDEYYEKFEFMYNGRLYKKPENEDSARRLLARLRKEAIEKATNKPAGKVFVPFSVEAPRLTPQPTPRK
jgi:hypothetical protein